MLKVFVHNNPEAEASRVELQDRGRACAKLLALGFFLMVIVNEKSLNLEKTTSSDLSALLLMYG